MAPFESIISAIHSLSHEEKLRLRSLLDDELNSLAAPHGNGAKSANGLIGLFADEPDLIDEVMDSAYEHRCRPLRVDE